MDYDPADDGLKSYYAAIEAKRARLTGADAMYCVECDRRETDPVFLDVELCSKCGSPIEASDDD